MTQARKFIRSNDVELNYVDDGEGPATLFVHGVGASLESWDGVVAQLPAGRRLIRFDLRGHGASAHTPGPYSLRDFVEDAVGLMDHLNVETFDLVGFSLGGLIAQAVALDHPQRLRSLSLISTVAGRTDDERAKVIRRAETLALQGAEAHLSAAVERWFTDAFRVAHPEVLEARRQRSLRNNPECYAAAYKVLALNDLADRLHEVDIPTLVMTGENDIGSSPRMARLIHKRISGSELHILPDLKHAVLLEAPDQVARILNQFLDPAAGRGDSRATR